MYVHLRDGFHIIIIFIILEVRLHCASVIHLIEEKAQNHTDRRSDRNADHGLSKRDPVIQHRREHGLQDQAQKRSRDHGRLPVITHGKLPDRKDRQRREPERDQAADHLRTAKHTRDQICELLSRREDARG